MSQTPLVSQPCLNWFGIWPGQAGRAWDQNGLRHMARAKLFSTAL